MIRAAAAVAASLLLASCGGGAPVASAPVVPIPARSSIDFAFFGTAGDQLLHTATFVSAIHADDFGDWDKDRAAIKQRIIAQMQEARARGVNRVILSTGFLTFDGQRRYLGAGALANFKAELDALDLSRMVVMLYPIDEPDVGGYGDATMVQAYNATREAWPGVPIGVIYGTKGPTPGITAADWIGRDDYGAGAGVLNDLPAIRADQRWIIVPGGADPYRQNPAPFVAFAQGDARVALVFAFLYIPYTDPQGAPRAGIGNNGMLPAYNAAACQLTGKC